MPHAEGHRADLIEYLPIFSRDVLCRITAWNDSWEAVVPAECAELIKRRAFFGYVKPG